MKELDQAKHTWKIYSGMTKETYDLLCNDPYINYYFVVDKSQPKAKTV